VDFPPAAVDFRPYWDWTHSYRIWTCHGYRESGNENVGVLRLERTGKSDNVFVLKVRETVSQVDGLLADIEANIECRNNTLASPVQWQVRSTFYGKDGKDIPELAGWKRGQATASVDRTTCDWCLFELVQRLEFGLDFSLKFDLLEGLELSKLNHELVYGGVFPTKISGLRHLHRFVQLGRGILPTEYWLDDNHRLLCVTSLNKACIYDEQAQKAVKTPTW